MSQNEPPGTGIAESEPAGAGKSAVALPAAGMTIVLATLVMLADGSDMTAMPLAVPHIAAELGVPAAAFGSALAGMPLGFGIGALLIGPFGDRFGRRPLIVGSMLLVAAATALSAAVGSPLSLALFRILVGVGLGACLTNLNALMAEVIPPGFRARAITVMGCGIPLGAAGISFATPWFIAIGGGWRGYFVILGMAVLAIGAATALWLTEAPSVSPAARRDAARPGGVMAGLTQFVRPLASGYRLRTALFLALYTVNAGGLYLLQSWLPTVLPAAGYSLTTSSWLTGVAQIGGSAGSVLISTMVDRKAAVPALIASYTLVGVSLLLFQITAPGGMTWAVLLFLTLGGISAAHLAIMAIGALLYPPSMTASALGLAVAVARTGAVAGPLAGQFLIAAGIGAPRFFLALLPLELICVGCVVFLPYAWGGGGSPSADDVRPA